MAEAVAGTSPCWDPDLPLAQDVRLSLHPSNLGGPDTKQATRAGRSEPCLSWAWPLATDSWTQPLLTKSRTPPAGEAGGPPRWGAC